MKGGASGAVLVLFARRPRLGHVKTRLAAALGETRAFELYVALLRDSIALLRRASQRGIRPVLAWADSDALRTGMDRGRPGTDSDRAALDSDTAALDSDTAALDSDRAALDIGRAALPSDTTAFDDDLAGVEIMRQEGDDLGQRMVNCFASLLARGHDRVAILGSDTPSLPLEILYRAFDLLRDRDLVLGPSTDGGYYLIGARAVVPEIFRGMAWGTEHVLPESLKILKILGVGFVLLPEWSDVDTLEDLERLRSSLSALPPADVTARHTRAALARIPSLESK